MLDKLFDVEVLKIIGPVGAVCLIFILVLFKMFFELFKMYREDRKKMEDRYEAIIKENREKFERIYSGMADVIDKNTAETSKSNTTLELMFQMLQNRARG